MLLWKIGTTCSNLRFGPKPFSSHYLVTHANYVSCHNPNYVQKLDLTKPLKKNSIFVLNSHWGTVEDMEKHLPHKMLRDIAKNNVKLYNIDAAKLAEEVGLGKRINNIMTVAFYKLSGVLPFD